MTVVMRILGIDDYGITNGIAEEVVDLGFGDGIGNVPDVESSSVTCLRGLDGGGVGGMEGPADEGVVLRTCLFLG